MSLKYLNNGNNTNNEIQSKKLRWVVMGDIGMYNLEFYQLLQNRKYDENWSG